jgi:hypothetical protein
LHIAGDINFFVGMFSCLNRISDSNSNPLKRESLVINFSFLLDDDEVLNCFLLNLPDANNIPFDFDIAHIAQGQQQDQELCQQHVVHPLKYPEQLFDDV